MITGTVTLSRDAIIRLEVLNARGQPVEFDAVVDTGFNGSLTLPQYVIQQLGMTWRLRGSVTLATGAQEACDIYAGAVLWDGRTVNILVEAADTDPLVGMKLMSGYRIIIEDIDGGSVIIERL